MTTFSPSPSPVQGLMEKDFFFRLGSVEADGGALGLIDFGEAFDFVDFVDGGGPGMVNLS